ncbi:DNA translocase FtsK [Spiribacter vilamensis]|uniref:DNA translocase FtsK n=1 Tax=Spiribacter vilamensis TaxID=531306 RepID=A0A4Q8CYT6_9GAMM|nr:DNA translocase FtsK [Spiribacter vilamensis]RZU98112.1 DNA translocase FtsK [Spiribacter vilamensis]TVO60986.1 cell division protein FtsK [Spiribacter vilamensis]
MAGKTTARQLVAPRTQHISRVIREAALLLLLAVAGFLMLSLLTYTPADPGWSQSGPVRGVGNAGGVVGAYWADLSLYLFGYLAYLLPALIVLLATLVYRWQRHGGSVHWAVMGVRVIGFLLTLFAGAAVARLHIPPVPGIVPLSSGGVLGNLVGDWGQEAFSFTGATLLALAVLLAGVTLFTGLSWILLMDRLGQIVLAQGKYLVALQGWIQSCSARLRAQVARQTTKYAERRQNRERNRPAIAAPARGKAVAGEPAPAPAPTSPSPAVLSTPASPPAPEKASRAERRRRPEPTPASAPGGRPPVSLLDAPQAEQPGYSEDVLETMSRLVETKLSDFGVQVEVVAVQPGPVITRFELRPAAGVKVSQISNLSKDLARALSVTAVRVVEVIPGKSVVGLEIPNEHRQVIALSEIIRADAFDKADSPLTLAIGKDIGGFTQVVDLAKMPHLLVAGTTGSGKSVGINAMIISMLYKNDPEQVRMIMIDPKMLELSVYDGIPHLLAPVVTDMKEAANALRWCVGEMERRYRLMSTLGVRNIDGANAKIREARGRGEPITDPLWDKGDGRIEPGIDGESPQAPLLEPMPYTVVVVDEFADMMMMVGKKVEELIARLAQKARAAGIHLILATQRPSVDVITGLIKANIPTRMAFQVSSRVDSRTILDQMGAESLLGHGDMLYLGPSSRGLPERVHGAFVSDAEVHRIAEHLKQTGSPEYVDGILDESGAEGAGAGALPGEANATGGESDPLYDQAVRIVTETRKASISGVQRRLKVGYNRAARLVEEMEAAGIVGPLQANGSREVIAPPPPGD